MKEMIKDVNEKAVNSSKVAVRVVAGEVIHKKIIDLMLERTPAIPTLKPKLKKMLGKFFYPL